jgi:hypothetical protein
MSLFQRKLQPLPRNYRQIPKPFSTYSIKNWVSDISKTSITYMEQISHNYLASTNVIVTPKRENLDYFFILRAQRIKRIIKEA